MSGNALDYDAMAQSRAEHEHGQRVTPPNFLRASAVTGGGLVVGFATTGCSSAPAPLPLASTEDGWTPNAFLQVLPDNTVRFYTARSEMGQGVTTGLSTLVGEELDVNPLDMEIRLAGAHEDYVNPDFGLQGTISSSSIHAHYLQLRQVGANTRALILEAASKDLAVPVSSLVTDNSFVVHGESRHPYSDFIVTAQTLKLRPTVQSPSQSSNILVRTLVGLMPSPKRRVPHSSALMSTCPVCITRWWSVHPWRGLKAQSVNAASAKRMLGVTNIFEISNGVAVVAESFWQAKQAAAKIRAMSHSTGVSEHRDTAP